MSAKIDPKFIHLFIALLAIILCIFLLTLDSDADELPDPNLTQGVAREVTVDQLCTTSTKLVRHTSQATKLAVYKEYGITPKHSPECTGPSHSCFEVDHDIALENGGADVIENMWIQEYEIIPNDPSWQNNGAHKKDKLENKLHKLICDKEMTIHEAQQCISSDWIACYMKVMP